MKRIGVLTGGGDVPGLNPAIKSVVLGALELGYRVLGIRRGWAGLLQYNLDEPSTYDYYVRELKRDDVRTIDRTGGTYLHSSRTNPAKMKALPPVVKGIEFPKSEMTKPKTITVKAK